MILDVSELKKRIQMIDEYYKNDELFLKICFEDYNTFHIYIRLDYEKSSESYKLRWFDLDRVRSNKISSYESSESIDRSTVEYIKSVVAEIEVPSKLGVGPDSNVSLYVANKCKNEDTLDIKFYRNIPNGMKDLAKIFEVVFLSLPKKINAFYEEINGKNALEYQYSKTFRFNLFKDDLGILYDASTLDVGEEYYKEKRVLFLDKQENKYVGVVKEEEELCVVVIKYDDKSHDMRVQCSCPMDDFCKHIYVVIKAIREDNVAGFYKVMPKKEAKEMFAEKKLDFKSMLCVGVVDKQLGIINDNGELVYYDILDDKGKVVWDIVEDDKKNGLKSIFKKMK